MAFALLYALCWSIYRDYGVSIDEPVHMMRVPLYFYQWRQIFEQGYVDRVDGGMRYGILFNLLAHPFITTFSRNTRFLLEAYEVKHIVTFHVYFLTYIAIAYGFHKACGFRYSVVLSVFILTLFPNLFGQGFFNPKDIPFAAFYTLASVLIGVRIASIMQNVQSGKDSRHYLYDGIFFALLIAAGSGVRIAGLALVPAGLLAMACCIHIMLFWKHVRTLLPLAGYTALFLSVFLLLIYPSAASAPLRWFSHSVSYFNNGTGLGNHATGSHILSYLYAKTPMVWLVLGIGGVTAFGWHFRALNPTLRSVGIMLLMQFLTLPLMMAILGTRTYHQERHFLLAYPPIAFFAGYGLMVGFAYLRKSALRPVFILATLLASANIAKEMILLHPYQYVYFNEVARYHPTPAYRPIEYWGISRKPLVRWLAANVTRRHGVQTQMWYAYAPSSIALHLYGSGKLWYSQQGKLVVGWSRPEGCRTMHREIRYLGDITLDLAGNFNCY